MRINRQGVALQMSPSACESITMLFWIILEQDPVFPTYIMINECKIYMTLLLRLRIPSFLPCPYYDSLCLAEFRQIVFHRNQISARFIVF